MISTPRAGACGIMGVMPRLHRMRRRGVVTGLASLILALLVGGAESVVQAQSQASTYGHLHVRESFRASDVSVGGRSVGYISLRRVRDQRVLLFRSFEFDRLPLLRLRVPAGTYRVSSWSRGCDSEPKCEDLGEPFGGCSRLLRVRSGETRRVTLLTELGHGCSVGSGPDRRPEVGGGRARAAAIHHVA